MQLKDLGYCDYQSYRFERLKKRLQDHFQDTMVIHQTKAANEPDLIYCSQIDLQTVINKIANLRKQARLEAIENDLELPRKNLRIQPLLHCISSQECSTGGKRIRY